MARPRAEKGASTEALQRWSGEAGRPGLGDRPQQLGQKGAARRSPARRGPQGSAAGSAAGSRAGSRAVGVQLSRESRGSAPDSRRGGADAAARGLLLPQCMEGLCLARGRLKAPHAAVRGAIPACGDGQCPGSLGAVRV